LCTTEEYHRIHTSIMETFQWGPHGWKSIHTILQGLENDETGRVPQDKSRGAATFFNAMRFLLPCPACKKHYSGGLDKNPVEPVLDFSQTAVQWGYDLHNRVNKGTGKTSTVELAKIQSKHAKFAADPDQWGPSMWEFLHAMTFAYSNNPSEEEQTAAVDLFESLKHVLPDQLSRENWEVLMSDMPVQPNVHSKEALTRWLYNVHDVINSQEENARPSFEDISTKYTNWKPWEMQFKERIHDAKDQDLAWMQDTISGTIASRNSLRDTWRKRSVGWPSMDDRFSQYHQ
jgi:hypothetical protein